MDRNERILSLDCEKRVSEIGSDLIKIRSVNPTDGMQEIADYVSGILKGIGLDYRQVESKPGMINVVGRLNGGPGPTLVLNGHMDVVPVGDPDRWSWDPFSGEIRDGYLLGRGASDMKAGLAGLLTALEEVAAWKELKGSILFMAVADEESGGDFGTKFLLEQGYTGDACLIAEPSGINPTIGQKGNIWLHVEAMGAPGHASLSPLLGDNAIIKMTKAIEAIYDVFNHDWTLPERERRLIEHTASILDADGRSANGKILGKTSVNVGRINGGEKINQIPGCCEADFDLRVPIGLKVQDVLDVIHQKIADKCPEGVKLSRNFPSNESNYTDPEAPFIQRLINVITRVTGRESQPTLQWASSDARFFRHRNIPTAQFGPAELEGIHGYNERVKVADMVDAVRVYTMLIDDMLNGGQPEQ